ncbi:MAG: ATP phosphoribosyltransferase regulatory subunit [Clostridia bacterium]
MDKWKIYTPEGAQDILFDECFAKRNIEQKIRNLFRECGYYEVETPTLEFYDVFASENGQIPNETMFKIFDQQGRILVLRPDLTVPIARITATKYRNMKFPLRYFYIGNTFRYNELGGGKQKEFTQAGVEILGVSTPEAEAEVIATAITSLRCTGLDNFQIDIGQIDFFRGIMEETGLSEKEIEQVRVLIDKKDNVALEELVYTHDIRDDLKELILNIPGLFGSADVIEKAEEIGLSEKTQKAIDNLRKVLEILDDYGYSKYVSVDLGMIQSLNYYTGIIFRGFTYGVGFPILTGGSYNNLVGQFGKNCPATGYSLGINMIMGALERQKIETDKPHVDSLICYGEKGRKNAFKICNELRNQGLSVEIDIENKGIDSAKEFAKGKDIGGVIFVFDEKKIEIHDIESGEITATTIEELVK